MKFGVITFPGSNCDQDLIYCLETNLGQQVARLWHKDRDLKGSDFVFLPGGFSYGDYLRSGAIARFSPIMESVSEHAARGGYVMGICNGFQILTEAHLLPGTLLHNRSMHFICKNTFIKPHSQETALTQGLEDRAYKIPIAHAEGNYFCSESEAQELMDKGQVLFQYCEEDGTVSETANPNGSIANIAGVCNEKGNVFGMMPHPERAADAILGNEDGKVLFESLLA